MWTLRHTERPFTLNAERGWHYHKRSKIVAEWRAAFRDLALEANIPPQVAIVVRATPYLVPRGRPQDVAAVFPAVKAGIDGIVDAGIIPDDSPTFVKSLTFDAPVRSEENALVLTIEAV